MGNRSTNLGKVIDSMDQERSPLTFNEQFAARRTWKALSEFTTISLRSLFMRRSELIAAGVVFYVKRPRYKNTRVVCWFPAVVMAWFVKKAAKGEVF